MTLAFWLDWTLAQSEIDCSRGLVRTAVVPPSSAVVLRRGTYCKFATFHKHKFRRLWSLLLVDFKRKGLSEGLSFSYKSSIFSS